MTQVPGLEMVGDVEAPVCEDGYCPVPAAEDTSSPDVRL
jgi:hypothetical protein